MAYQVNPARNKRKSRKNVDITQSEFSGGYQSTIDNSRRKQNSLSSMYNMELVQDNVVRPRAPLIRYGIQPTLPVVGRGKYRWNGERGLLWVLNDGGVGKIYKQVNGGAFELIGGEYDVNSWTMFCQSKGKVFPFNGTDSLSYVDLQTDTVVTFVSLPTPAAPTGAASANLVSGSLSHDYYYRISANNAVGESIASVVSTAISVNTLREGWSSETAIAKTVALTWTTVTGATSYTVYVGTNSLTTNELVTVTGLGYIDDGSLAINPYKLAPEGNSTEGFTARWIYNDAKNSQIFGVSDDNKLYYSSPGTSDFSPYNGGGWVSIDEDGDTDLNFVDGFRDGKGDPVITTSSRGVAGKGLLSHVTFDSLTVADQVIIYPNVYPASGQSGTYAPRATIKTRDSITYFTGQEVKSTGTSQNVMNILTTNSISQVIEPDLDKINLEALKDAVGVEYKDRGFFALPVNSNVNNEIWYIDFSRKNAWVLRWSVAARDLWLYEDTLGNTHFCVLVGDVILEFSRKGSQTHQDDGVSWRSEVGYNALIWDKAGITLGKIRNQYFKLLQPKGKIVSTSTGIGRRGVQSSVGQDTFTTTTTYTGYDVYIYDSYEYDADPGQINSYGKSIAVLNVKPKGLLNQLSWSVVGEGSGTDYILSSVTSRGWSSDELIMKTRN